MRENRISGLFDTTFDASQRRPANQQPANDLSPFIQVVQTNDIYQMARARALFDQELDRLFNSGDQVG